MKQLDENTNREIMRKQEALLKYYQKSLSGKNFKALHQFVASGKAPGSSDFFLLNKMVKEAVIKLNLSGIEIMLKNTKNPFKKVQFWLARFMTRRLVAVKDPRKKKKKK